jgi:hypothetical protein
MFVPHMKHAYGPPRSVTELALLTFYWLRFRKWTDMIVQLSMVHASVCMDCRLLDSSVRFERTWRWMERHS